MTRIVCAALSLFFFTSSAQGDLLNITLTGSDLLSNGNVTFYESATAGPGSSIQFLNEGPSFGSANQFLLSYNFLPAGSRSNLSIEIDVDFTVLLDNNGGSDSDLVFGINDGVNIAAIERSDNDSGRWFQVQGSVSGIQNPPVTQPPVTTGLGNVEVNSMSYMIDSGMMTTLNVTEGGVGSGAISYASNPLAASNGMTFFFGRGGTNENYQINSISIRAVPEPSVLSICLFGLGSVLLGRRRRA